jgi:hypothetical protein
MSDSLERCIHCTVYIHYKDHARFAFKYFDISMNNITSVTIEGEIESTLQVMDSLRGKQKQGRENERDTDKERMRDRLNEREMKTSQHLHCETRRMNNFKEVHTSISLLSVISGGMLPAFPFSQSFFSLWDRQHPSYIS